LTSSTPASTKQTHETKE